MKIIAKRPFISSRSGFGNIPAGRILDTDDAYAKMLIKAGLAEEYSAAPTLMADRQTSFTSPVEANVVSGPSSQAGQALRSQTVIKSKRGVKKTKTAR